MSLEQQARQSLDMAVARLRDDLVAQLHTIVQVTEEKAEQDLVAAIDEARHAMEAEFGRRTAETLEAARAEWDTAQREHLAILEQRWRGVAEQQAVAVAEVQSAAEADAERRTAEAVDRARSEWEAEQRDRLVDLEKRWNAEADEREASAIQAAIANVRAQVDTVAASQLAAGLEQAHAEWARVLTALDRIESAGSLTATLDALADAVAGETRRSMVLLNRDEELRAWRLHGFGDELETVGLRVPSREAGPLGEAIRLTIPVRVRGDAFAPSGPASICFAELTANDVGIVVPVTIGPDAVAIVYADDGGAAGTSAAAGWPEVVQVLARYASRHLAALTAIRAAHVSGILKYESWQEPAEEAGAVA